MQSYSGRRGGGQTGFTRPTLQHQARHSLSLLPAPGPPAGRQGPPHDPPPMLYHFFILGQDKVIIAEGHTEDDRCDAFEAVDPLLPLRPLPTDIKHPAEAQHRLRGHTELCPDTGGGGGSWKGLQTSGVQCKPGTQPGSNPEPRRALIVFRAISAEQLEVQLSAADSPGHACFVPCLPFP